MLFIIQKRSGAAVYEYIFSNTSQHSMGWKSDEFPTQMLLCFYMLSIVNFYMFSIVNLSTFILRRYLIVLIWILQNYIFRF